MGEPCSPPSAPSRRDGFVPKGAPPPSVSSPPCLCSLLHRPRKVGIHLGGETPDAPASLRSGLLGAEAGAPGGRAGQGARAGQRARRAARSWPLGRSWAFSGATPAPAGPRLRFAARGGRRRRSGKSSVLRSPLAQPLPTSGEPPLGSLEKPTRPPPQARSRGSCRPSDLRPRDPYFKCDLWSRFHRPPPPPRAHNGLCVLCVFHLGLVCPRSPRGPPLPARSPLHVRPLCFALGCPRCAPEPSGAHTQGRFLSFLFPNESCCSKAGNEIKIARRTPKWSSAAAQPHPTLLPAPRAPPARPGGAPRVKRAPERVFGEAGEERGWGGVPGAAARGSWARYGSPRRPRSGGAGAIVRARCVSASQAGREPSPAAARNGEDAARRPRPA